MTNLTEQLATERLPEYTEFYVRKKDGSTDTQTWLNRRHSSAVEWWNTFNIAEVLAPVPSYEQWIMTKNLSERAHLEMYKARGEKVRLEKENTKLKELLKECREILYIEEMVAGNPRYIDELKILIKRINQVLGEE